MRFGLIVLLVFVFAVAGASFGALNSQAIELDFYFGTLTVVKGGIVIGALLLGWLLGGLLVYLGLVLPLRRRLRAQSRRLKQLEAQTHAGADAAIVTPPAADA
ncbi:MAG TPA: lipopolysaccharide assembly protein LapA domain-containing protein [Rudaea sp.]|nr:lipopolysaccharide assembly protein LapA domain-containing protein [Rudaea sp.]